MFIVMFILALTGILGRIVYTFYRDYEKTIIVQVEQHLLTIAEEISTSIELFIKEKADSLKVVGNNRQLADSIDKVNGISEKNFLKAYYDAQKDAIQRVYVINKAGKMVFQYPQPDEKLMPKINAMLQTDINRVIHNQRSMLGSAQKDEVGQFVLNIYEPIFEKWEFKGILVSSIRLDAIYKNLVQPVVPGKKGYTMVKDMEGTIIMHPTKNQIGIHVLETRKKRNPELDFTDLEKLIERQLKGEKGTAEYYSYWWQDKVLTKTKKLNGFAPAHIGDYFWVVAVLMSYEEIEGPIRQNLIRIVQITIIIVLMLSGTIFIILKIQRNQEALEVETKYLKELNHALEELRARDMQLQHSQKLQMVGTLTGGIAHEFNNLLTPILGYSEILKDKFDENSETYDEVNEIFGASSKAKDLIEQLLIFGRSDNGVSKHRLTQVSGLVDETLKLIKSIITPNIEVVVENCDKQVWIMANRAQVHQVIFNLCTNAFHAMKYKGGVLRVMVNTVCADQAPRNNFNTVVTGEYVRITVSDTGSGISKEAIDKIFEPFFTTKPVGEGTGLGLFVVRKIVETHNGIITVKSEPNQGSKFEVYFAKINDWRNESEEYKPKIDSINATLSVLLIDDKQKVLKVIKKGLESKGFKVIAEINSIDALRIFDDNPARFDVVITDQTMPHIKGLELAERFKQIRPDIKIILITGFVEEQVLECKERRVIDDYMVKPISAEHMAEKIAEVIQKE